MIPPAAITEEVLKTRRGARTAVRHAPRRVPSPRGPSRAGLGSAALGVLAFSLTIPATVLALDGLDPYLIGIGRAGVATVLAVLVIAFTALRGTMVRPLGPQWAGLLVAGLGVVFGFPVLSTLALDHGASSAHAAIVVGLLPAATAVLATLRAGERPSAVFWVASAAGAVCVSGFALVRAGGRFAPADLLLFGALLSGALGYAEGGRLARDMPGRLVICWALVLTGPLSVPLTVGLLAAGDPRWSGKALAGFAYVSVVSMFLGFFAWYAGLGRAGVARASQLQLAQPLLTLAWSALLLGERIDGFTGIAAVGVLACVAATQWARVRAAGPQLLPDPAPQILRDVTSERTMGEQVSQTGDRVGVAGDRTADMGDRTAER